MKNFGRALARIAREMESMDLDDQREAARQVWKRYGSPLTEVERSSRYRDRRRHEKVTASVTMNGHEGVTASPTPPDVFPESVSLLDPKDSVTTGARTRPEKKPAFAIPVTILEALGKCPTLLAIGRADVTLYKPRVWQAFVRAYPGVNFARELLHAEAWALSNPQKAPRSSVPAFLHRWFKRAAERLEAE